MPAVPPYPPRMTTANVSWCCQLSSRDRITSWLDVQHGSQWAETQVWPWPVPSGLWEESVSCLSQLLEATVILGWRPFLCPYSQQCGLPLSCPLLALLPISLTRTHLGNPRYHMKVLNLILSAGPSCHMRYKFTGIRRGMCLAWWRRCVQPTGGKAWSCVCLPLSGPWGDRGPVSLGCWYISAFRQGQTLLECEMEPRGRPLSTIPLIGGPAPSPIHTDPGPLETRNTADLGRWHCPTEPPLESRQHLNPEHTCTLCGVRPPRPDSDSSVPAPLSSPAPATPQGGLHHLVDFITWCPTALLLLSRHTWSSLLPARMQSHSRGP